MLLFIYFYSMAKQILDKSTVEDVIGNGIATILMCALYVLGVIGWVKLITSLI